jgi:hypothetical protein
MHGVSTPPIVVMYLDIGMIMHGVSTQRQWINPTPPWKKYPKSTGHNQDIRIVNESSE